MRTRTAPPSGQALATRARWIATAAAIACVARPNTTKIASPWVSTSRPSCAANAVRNRARWTASISGYWSPRCTVSGVLSSTSVCSTVTVPPSSSGMDALHSARLSRYSILTGSPRRIVPPRTTAAYTPTLTWLCWAAVRRIPGSLARSPCARVVITQRPQGPVMFRRTAGPMASVWPTQAFSAKLFSLGPSCATIFGRKRRASKRPSGYNSRRRASVAVVNRWTMATSKNVPSGSVKSVTVSRWSRPAMSGQYSSALTAPRWAARNVTSRLSAFERIWLRSPWSLVTVVPSGRAIRTVGTFAAARAGSMKVARKSKRRGHFRGFLAVAAFPSELSTRAYARSPSSPRSVTSVAFSSSPIMDLTGYSQSETTEPSSICTAFDILTLLDCSTRDSPLTIDSSFVTSLRPANKLLGQVSGRETSQAWWLYRRSSKSDRSRRLPQFAVTSGLQEEHLEIIWGHADRVQHADMAQSAVRAQSVDSFGRYREMVGDLPHRQQRPQPVRKILVKRRENLLRSPFEAAGRRFDSCQARHSTRRSSGTFGRASSFTAG